MARIFLFGSAVVGVLVVTIAYAVWSGQYAAEQPATPTPGASASLEPGASSSAAASAAASASASAAVSPSASVEASPSASTAAEVVTIVNLTFGPDLTIAGGSTVTFINNDPVLHTATNGEHGKPTPGSLFNLPLAIGGSGSYTFTGPGTYQVTCTLHAFMNMTITVQ